MKHAVPVEQVFRASVRAKLARIVRYYQFASECPSDQTLDLETFLRSSDLPYAVCEYIRTQNERISQ